MKLIKAFFVIGALLFLQASVAENLDGLLNHIKTFSANFTQRLIDDNDELLQTTVGTVKIEKPDRFRWDISKPSKQVILSDGKYLWIYNVNLEQVTKDNLHKAIKGTPAELISGSVKYLYDNFTVKKESESVYILTAKDKESIYQQLHLIFQNKNLTSMVLKDSLGQTIRLTFSNITLNQSLPASIFKMRYPKDSDLIDNTVSS